MRILTLDSVASTNTWLSAEGGDLTEECMVVAREQTAGRGQRGNSWEAEPGKNITASFLLFPEGVEAHRQFLISEAVALAVVDLLADLGVEARVKWPNDIYGGDRKIAGILIENAVMGRRICRTIAGIGLNLNQERFLSDAPNPVSLRQLTGRDTDVADASRMLAEAVGRRMRMAGEESGRLHEEYLRRLWRGEGAFHPFLHKGANRRISARIEGVDLDGTLRLVDSEGESHAFLFKEVEFLLGVGSWELRGER